ncbi:MAG: chemotaxis response regulator protein-glutamate methylesterase [candidate division WOR-3 bacterium]
MIDVLIVEDSAFMRKVLSEIMEEDPEIRVIDSAVNGLEGVKKASLFKPDVITMDVEMPNMDGIEAVKEIMKICPTPIIMVSAYTKKGAQKTIETLISGAVDFVEKPGGPISLNIREIKEEIIEKVKIASKANLKTASKKKQISLSKKSMGDSLVIIAASTGGPKIISAIFKKIPDDFPAPIVVIQHMPGTFTKAFAKRLNEHSPLSVMEAKEGNLLKKGTAYIAPGDFHLEIDYDRRIKLNKKPSLHGVRPSADITMNSASENFDGNLIGIVLSGMGRDGSIGVRNISKRGGFVIAQDKDTSVVYGMPKSAIDSGCVDLVLPSNEIADKLIALVKKDV